MPHGQSKSMRQTVHKALGGIGLLLGLAPLFGSVAAITPMPGRKTLDRTADPVTIDGEHFSNLLGSDIGHLRLFAFQDGRPVPIPFQIDQRDSSGEWVWDVAYAENGPSSDSDFGETQS
jgi:hypothetical protein